MAVAEGRANRVPRHGPLEFALPESAMACSRCRLDCPPYSTHSGWSATLNESAATHTEGGVFTPASTVFTSAQTYTDIRVESVNLCAGCVAALRKASTESAMTELVGMDSPQARATSLGIDAILAGWVVVGALVGRWVGGGLGWAIGIGALVLFGGAILGVHLAGGKTRARLAILAQEGGRRSRGWDRSFSRNITAEMALGVAF